MITLLSAHYSQRSPDPVRRFLSPWWCPDDAHFSREFSSHWSEPILSLYRYHFHVGRVLPSRAPGPSALPFCRNYEQPTSKLVPISWESFNLRCNFLSLVCSIYIMFVGSLNPLCLDGGEQTGVWGLDGAAWIIHLNVLKPDEPESRDSAARSRVQELQHTAARAQTRVSGPGAHVLTAEVTSPLPGHQRGHVRRRHEARQQPRGERLPLPAQAPGQAQVQTPGPVQK